MIRGLRASDAADLRRRTGGDMRLLLRIGALLEARIAFTPLALDRLLGDEAGRRLIADRSLPTAFAAAASAAGIDDLRMIGEDEGCEAGWRVIALADEIGNPFSAEPAGDGAPAAEAGLPALVGGLSPALRDPVEGLMQARADDQRAAALERLRYASPPLAVVGELMPLLLADGAELVRERAVALVGAAGGHALIVDLVRALQRRDAAALPRLAAAVSALPADQQDLAISAAAACAARGDASQGLVEVCTALAPTLARHRLLDRLIERLLPTAFSLVELVRALQREAPERVTAALRAGLGFGAAQDARVIVLLAAPGATAEAALVERGIELLIGAEEEPRERMPLAAALRRLAGPSLAAAIAARGMRLAAARDTSVHWLLAELCRDGVVDPATAGELARIIRQMLREAPGPHLISIMEQQLPMLLPCAREERARFAEPLVEILARYRADRTVDLALAGLAGIGADAITAAWEAAEHHPMAHVRLLVVQAMPDLVAQAPAGSAGAVRRLIGGLARAEQGDERGALIAAAARIAAAGELAGDRAVAAAIDAAAAGLGRHAYEALGHLAASPGCTAERRAAIVDDLLMEACAELPDAPTTTVADPATGETTYQLDDRLAAHTEHVPRILAALGRIGASPACEPDLLRRLVERLVAQWRQVASWRLVWGPGNVHELAATLARLAGAAAFPGPLRVRVAEALLPQVGQLHVARSLARVLAVGEGPYAARLAGRAAEDLVRLAARGGEFAEDERGDLAEVLSEFLAIPALGPDADGVRRRLVGVLATLRDHAGSRTRARLRFLRGDLASDLAERLDWA
jgi:hypothetical protein